MRRRAFKVRRAGTADVAGMCAVQHAIVREGVLHGEQPDTPAHLRRRLTPVAIVAEAGGRIVGFANAAIRRAKGESVFRGARRYMEVDAVYVAARWRGRGVGTAILRRLLTECRRLGHRRFYVYTGNTRLERTIRFYRRAGFRTWYATLFI